MAGVDIPSGGDIAAGASTLLDKGKKLLDQGRAAFGRANGIYGAGTDLSKINEIADDENLTAREKATLILDVLRTRLVGNDFGGIMLPTNEDQVISDLGLTDGANAVVKKIVMVYVDP